MVHRVEGGVGEVADLGCWGWGKGGGRTGRGLERGVMGLLLLLLLLLQSLQLLQFGLGFFVVILLEFVARLDRNVGCLLIRMRWRGRGGGRGLLMKLWLLLERENVGHVDECLLNLP